MHAAAGPAAAADVEVRDGKMLIGTPATAVTVLDMEKHGVDVDEIGSKAEFPANGKFTSPHQFFKYVGELVEDVGGGAIHSKEPLDESSPLFLAARKLNQKIDATYTTQYEYFKLMESKLGQGWKVRLEWDDPVALLKSTPEQLVGKTVGAGLGRIVDLYYRAPTSYHIHENYSVPLFLKQSRDRNLGRREDPRQEGGLRLGPRGRRQEEGTEEGGGGGGRLRGAPARVPNGAPLGTCNLNLISSALCAYSPAAHSS